MTRPAKILLIGNIYDNHICRFVIHIKDVNPNVEIDIFNIFIKNKEYPQSAKLYNHIYTKKQHFPNFLYSIPKLRGLISVFADPKISFKLLKNNKYDVVNIHFLTIDSYSIRKKLYKLSNKLMITPWGSDVYRIGNGWKKNCLQKVYDMADYVSAPKIKFRDDVVEKFNVPQNKIVDLGFGSDSIDTIINHKNITRDNAKRKLNIAGNYVIACGYNGSKGQNHTEIINALAKIKNKIPEKLVLILQMTYGATPQYIAEIKTLLEKNSFKYILFDKYLSEEELLYVRKSADMFIHAQLTDAFSGSIQEYILCGAKVINGKWTRYSTLETYEIPYYLFNSFVELSNVILNAYNENEIEISQKTINHIEEKGWSHMITGWSDFYNCCVK